MMDSSLYQPLFLTVVGVLTVVYAARLYSYAHSYENVEFGYSGFNTQGEWLFTNIMVFCRESGLSVHVFFTFISLAYVLTALWAMTILVPRNPMLGMIFVLGSLMFFIGFISVIVVGALKLYHMHAGHHYILVTDSPYFYLALTTMVIGTQLFLAGFIGELIARNSDRRNHYEISENLNLETKDN